MTVALSWHARQTADSAEQRLRARVDRLVQDADGPEERSFLGGLVERLCRPDPMLGRSPEAAGRIFQVLSREQVALRDVARALERDPELVLEVWRQAWPRAGNASASIEQAISRLGLDALWRVAVLEASTARVYVAPGFEARSNRERALGLMTANLAAASLPGSRATAYLAGLLHGIGAMWVYRCALPDNPSRVPDRALVERTAAELAPESGALYLQGRGLQASVVQAVAFSADPTLAPAGARPIARAVFAGRAVSLHVAGLALETRVELYQRLDRVQMSPAEANRLLYLARQAHGHVGDLVP